MSNCSQCKHAEKIDYHGHISLTTLCKKGRLSSYKRKKCIEYRKGKHDEY